MIIIRHEYIVMNKEYILEGTRVVLLATPCGHRQQGLSLMWLYKTYYLGGYHSALDLENWSLSENTLEFVLSSPLSQRLNPTWQDDQKMTYGWSNYIM